MTTSIDKLADASNELIELRAAFADQKKKASTLSEEVMRNRLAFGEYEQKLKEMEALRAERDALAQKVSDAASRERRLEESLAKAEKEAASGRAAQETLKALGSALEALEA